MAKIIYRFDEATGKLERLEEDAAMEFEAAVQEFLATSQSMEIKITANDLDEVAQFAKRYLPAEVRNELDAIDTMMTTLQARSDSTCDAVQRALGTLINEHNAVWSSQEGRLALDVATHVCFFGEEENQAMKNRLAKGVRGQPYERPTYL